MPNTLPLGADARRRAAACPPSPTVPSTYHPSGRTPNCPTTSVSSAGRCQEVSIPSPLNRPPGVKQGRRRAVKPPGQRTRRCSRCNAVGAAIIVRRNASFSIRSCRGLGLRGAIRKRNGYRRKNRPARPIKPQNRRYRWPRRPRVEGKGRAGKTAPAAIIAPNGNAARGRRPGLLPPRLRPENWPEVINPEKMMSTR